MRLPLLVVNHISNEFHLFINLMSICPEKSSPISQEKAVHVHVELPMYTDRQNTCDKSK